MVTKNVSAMSFKVAANTRAGAVDTLHSRQIAVAHC
jgi:hypothetical protein